MLKALYDYANKHSLVPPPGYVEKTVKAYVSLSSLAEDFAEVEMGGQQAVRCPDIGSLANGKDKCNVLAEKRSIIFSGKSSPKSQFFWDALREAGEYEPAAKACLRILEKPEIIERIDQKLDAHKVKASDRIAFKVDGKALLDGEKIQDWWQGFRAQFLKTKESADTICMVSAKPTAPVMTTSKISGLKAVGGHASGDALICFDKAAFCSYGFKKAENAPVSEEAFAAVKAALDSLLKDAPILSDMRFVHWYNCDVKREEDPIYQCGDFFQDDDDEDEEEEELSAMEIRQKEITEGKKADKLVQSLETGKEPVPLDSIYYILLLSGVNGRIMIRRYECGRYKDLQKNLQIWHEDLKLRNAAGTAPVSDCKLKARLIRLLKHRKSDPKVFESLRNELAGITPVIIMAILTGGRMPDAVAARALRYIRSQMLASADAGKDEGRMPQIPDGWACQWLKVWLIRKKRAEGEEEFLVETYNIKHPSAAYHCGGLMAVYAKIQQRAIEGVNAGVIQRYYASASRTPAIVLSRLARLCNYHLAKLEKTKFFEDRLAELYSALGDEIPVTLNLEEQSYFALGYYQQWSELNTRKAAKEDGQPGGEGETQEQSSGNGSEAEIGQSSGNGTAMEMGQAVENEMEM